MKAILKQYRQSPRKVRLVIDAIRGKSVERALAELKFISKRASKTIEKLIKSAVSNAETSFGETKDNLFIKEIRVDEGITLKRIMPMSNGRAFRINKRASHITLELGKKVPKKSQITNSLPTADLPKRDKSQKTQVKKSENKIKSEKSEKPKKIVRKEKVTKKK